MTNWNKEFDEHIRPKIQMDKLGIQVIEHIPDDFEIFCMNPVIMQPRQESATPPMDGQVWIGLMIFGAIFAIAGITTTIGIWAVSDFIKSILASWHG